MIQKITKNTPQEYIEEINTVCKKCGNCCSQGSGFVLKKEVDKIAKHLELSEEEVKTKFLTEVEFFNTKQFRLKMNIPKDSIRPHGNCVFLRADHCSIQDAKPLHCRISNCNEFGDEVQTWFLVNFFLNPNDPESIRQYSSFLKTGGRLLKGAELEKLVPDKETLKKILDFERIK
ncbi:YkgJ family cysteine cluster protein [Candidatus Woesearchaeota archaeon]|jgi:Fe-S-cluster containining protein|nr:YkgJ family cysteine cluster protein [Candidatus Woesearchaeota archaeon]